MSAGTYGIDSIHINIGQGDSAIHLLIENPRNVRPTILRATLFDGGEGNANNLSSIKGTIDAIQRDYTFPAGTTTLKFDSIVVTHWDSDHYKGVVNLIKDDIGNQRPKPGDGDKLGCRYFKYTGNDRKKPETTFYAPYWTGTAKSPPKPPPAKMPRGVNDRPEVLRENATTKGRMDFLYEQPGTNIWFDEICNLSYEPEEMLGVNFLTNEKLKAGVLYKDVKTPKLLIDNVAHPYPVGIFCVSSRGAVLGDADPPFPVLIIDDKNEKKNWHSVGAVVLWKDTEHISHYFAGDAMYITERKIKDWVGRGKVTTVPSMKLSHHGAATSTPADMLTQFQPVNLVVSAGSSNHGHPRWELLFYINAWLLSRSKADASARPIFATQYPYYLREDDTKLFPDKGISCGVFVEKPTGQKKVFLGGLKKFYDDINAAAVSATPKLRQVKDIKGQFDSWLSLRRKPDKVKEKKAYEIWQYNNLAWIDHQVESAWSSMSQMYVPADKRMPTANSITVKSRDGTVNKDGTVQVNLPSGPKTYPKLSVMSALNVAISTDPAAIDPGPTPLFPDIDDTLLKRVSPSPPSPLPLPPSRTTVPLSPSLVMLNTTGGSTLMPMRVTGGRLTAQDTGYYIVCSKIESTDPNVRQLAGGTPLNNFVAVLHSQKFGLTSKPAIKSSTPFLSTDEWSSWLVDAISATAFAAKTDDQGNVSGFTLEVDWPDSNAADHNTVRFDTDYVVPAFNILPDAKPPVGLLGDTDIIAFGLDSSQNLTLKTDLEGALKYAGLGDLISSPLVTTLGTKISLTLSAKPESSTGARNAVWFEPRKAYRTTIRLQWDINDIDKVKEYISFLKGAFTLESIHLITRRTSTWAMTADGVSVVTAGEAILSAEFSIAGKKFIGALTFSEDSVRMELTTKENVFKEIVDWLATTTGDIPFAEWLLSAGAEVFRTIRLRRISLTVKMVDGQRKITNFSVATEIEMGLGGTEDNPARVLMTYASVEGVKMGNFRGQLWFSSRGTTIAPLLFPDWEEAQDLSPLTPGQSSSFDLARLHPSGVLNIPQGIPHQVTEAFLEVDSTAISFFGKITCEAPPPGPVPTITLGLVSLGAKYTFGGSESKGELDLALDIDVEIQAPETSQFQSPTTITGSLEYDHGAWRLYGSMKPLFASTLYQFFDPDAQGGVMTFLEALEIRGLELEYNYKEGVANNFRFEGILVLGELELNLEYKYDTDGWSFDAVLGATTEQSTLGSIIESITGDTDLLLPFVADIPVTAASEGGAVSVRCNKKPKKAESEGSLGKPEDFILFFSASVQIKPLKATFVQYRDLGWAATIAPKRVFKVSVSGLPAIDVPLVGNLTQPFDEMFYMWVQDKALQASTKKLPGLSDKEVEYINNALELKPGVQTDELLYKETRKKETKKDTDVVIAAGSHFVLVLKDKDTRKVVIDYTFADKKKQKGTKAKMLTEGASGEEGWEEGDAEEEFEALEEEPPEGESGDSSMAPYKKTVGPITISNIGFKFKDNNLSILLDAAFLLGPIGFMLIGFSIDVNLEGATLKNLPTPSFSLSGLAVSFDQPPIRLAGMYTHVDNDDIEYYAGGIIVSFTPYLFQAAGFYGETKQPKPFTSVFVFGKLDGPLVTLEFAEISGITGGFGYNTDLRFPAVAEVPEFPFVAGTGVGKDIMTTLQNLVLPGTGGWFNPRDGSFWVGAGLKVSAFETLSIDAVVVVEWNPYVKLGIFGVAVADIPRGSPKTFAHVELGISAVVDFQAGVMKFEAQLSPNSYIFHPSCHLTGGFALYYWFKGADPKLEGDWVFTIGGFHRAFDRPRHYPNPPRLAITWSVDKNISITGEAYFAITPKCCMGGGRLSASLKLGPIEAWFDAYADFLINYKPFHFMADGGVSVGVNCKVDLLITSFTIEVEIDAQLHLEGPPLCGRVHVNFYVTAFDIDFGPNPEKTKAVSLQEFYQLVLQSGEGSSMSSSSLLMLEEEEGEKSDDDKAHVFGCRSGLMEGKGDQETEENKPWEVRSGTFSFGISCRFAIGKATVEPSNEFPTSEKGDEGPVTDPVSWDTPIYAKPMHLTEALTSEIEISINRTEAFSAFLTEEEFQEPQWQMKPIIKSVPSALWGQYNRDQDPQEKGNNIRALLNGDGVAIQLMMGIEITAPKPTLSEDKIPKFNAIDAMSQSVFVQGQEPIFPKYTDASGSWSPGKVEDEDGQWKAVHDLWEKPEAGVESRQKTIDLWKEAMFWEKELRGDAPEILLNKFDNLYLAAPLISVG